AESEHAQALLVVMNTPGGLSTSMDDMVTSLLNSRVPVVVYVAPVGARADSAGLFVAQSADVVAMAPGTNFGSAHPITATGRGHRGGPGKKDVYPPGAADFNPARPPTPHPGLVGRRGRESGPMSV